MTWIIDPALKKWAAPRQAEAIDAVNLHGSERKAAKALGMDQANLNKTLKNLKRRAAAQGYSPDEGLGRIVPEPFVAKGHSTLDRIDPETGERTQILQWTKTAIDWQFFSEMVKEGVREFVSQTTALTAPPAPLDFDRDIIPFINIGDAHLGMLAHAAETGQNFDLKIAESDLLTAIEMLLADLPPCERIVINDLGDFTHYENMKGETEASGHKLDYDGRFPKMIRTYSRVFRLVVDMALTKAQYVDVIVNQGNHSRTNDIWMAELLRVAYGHTGRVNVLNNDNVFIAYRMGNTLVMIHHSDKCRPRDLANVMTTDFRKDYGETEHHYIDIGHIHHAMVLKEHPSIFIESFNNLAPNDKWAHEAGYRSRKSITVVYRSRTYGDVGRRVLPIQQIRDRINATATGKRRAIEPLKAFAV